MYKETHCISCGCLIPEGEILCSNCGDYDDMQTFKYLNPKKPKGKWTARPIVFGAAYCSVCGHEYTFNSTKFCPECGSEIQIESK